MMNEMNDDATDAAWHQKMCEEIQQQLEADELPELDPDLIQRLLDNDEDYQEWLTQREIENGSARTMPPQNPSLYEILKGAS